MSFAVQLFWILLVSGLFLIGAEIFVPGGILGAIGGLALVGAIISGFIAFPTAGPYVAIGIVVLVGVAIAVWIRFFPKSRFGKRMTVSEDLHEAHATEQGISELVGKTGKASSALRPAGFAIIEGRRIDVVTQGEMIEQGSNIKVVEVEANRVIVTKVEE